MDTECSLGLQILSISCWAPALQGPGCRYGLGFSPDVSSPMAGRNRLVMRRTRHDKADETKVHAEVGAWSPSCEGSLAGFPTPQHLQGVG